jgi:hypothetical protein
MENQSILDTDANSGNSEMGLSSRTRGFLLEAAKWARILAILGFIMVGIMVLFALFAGTMFSALSNSMGDSPMPAFPGAMFSLIYLAVAALYFFPILYLYKFANGIREAFQREDEPALMKAFQNLKSHYKFLGILALITIGFYAVSLIFALVGGLLASAF